MEKSISKRKNAAKERKNDNKAEDENEIEEE